MDVGAQQMITVKPGQARGPVLNPGKGWISYGWSNGKTKQEIDLTSVGYTRFEWSALEPSEEKFNWKNLDGFIKSWAKHGKQVAFGVMNANSHSGAKDGYVTPKWVFDDGVKDKSWEVKSGADAMTGNPGWKREPANWHDPILMKKIGNFVKAMAARYDGHPAIAFIDIRSYSNWGETMSEKHALLYAASFKKTRLCQSTHMRGAKSQAAWCAKRGIAVRRDGIGGSKGEELIPAAGLVPAIFEFWGPVSYLKHRKWWRNGKLVPEAIEIGKPTYVEIVRGSPEFLRDHRGVIDSVTNRIGFHFVLEEAQYPKQIPKARSTSVRLSWRNGGVAPIYVPCVAQAALVDSNSRIVAVSRLKGSKPSTWVPGKSVRETAKLMFAGAHLRGRYKLAIGLFRSARDKEPTFLLGIETPMVGKWHVLGSVAVD